MGLAVGAIMAIGAMFGRLNTMFAAVAARAREIATCARSASRACRWWWR
jgi:putative ABC transport system permease protein